MSGELRSWEDVKKDLLKNPETASAYNDLEGNINSSAPSSSPGWKRNCLRLTSLPEWEQAKAISAGWNPDATTLRCNF